MLMGGTTFPINKAIEEYFGVGVGERSRRHSKNPPPIRLGSVGWSVELDFDLQSESQVEIRSSIPVSGQNSSIVIDFFKWPQSGGGARLLGGGGGS